VRTILSPKRHPLPNRAVGESGIDFDFAADLARTAVDHLARLVVAHVERVVRRDHRVAVDHESFRELPPPQNRAVVGVDREQRVQHLVLVRLVRDVPHGLEDAAAGDDRLLRHRAELRHTNELRPELALDVLVG
jgi:hypothetical protein